MRRKPVLLVFLTLLLICLAFTFTACDEDEVSPVERISLTSLPQLEYLKGQPFVLNDAQITVYYADGTAEILPLTLEMISDYDVQAVGKHTITIKYENVTTSLSVVINNSAITKVEVVDGEVAYKKTYIVDQLFDYSNIFLKISYESGTPDIIPVTEDMISGINMKKVGKRELTVSYLDEYEAKFVIDIVDKSVSAISIVEVPDKRLYLLNETIDDIGGILHISYDNGYTENKKFSALFATAEEKSEAYEYDFSYVQNRSVVTMRYKGKSVIFDVKVLKKAATDFLLKQQPIGSQIVGTDLNLGGGLLEITYNNDTTETVAMTDSKVSASGYSRNDEGNQTITLSFSDVPETFSFSIDVIAATPIGLDILPPVDYEGKTVVFYQNTMVDLTNWHYRLLLNNGQYTAPIALSSDMYVPDGSGKDLLNLDTYGMRVLSFSYQVSAEQVLTSVYNLSVTRKVISSLTVEKPTLAIYFRGGELNLTGSSFTALFNDGDTVGGVITSDMVSGYNSSVVGYQDVTVTYKNPSDESDFKRATFKVLIVRRATALEIQSVGKSTYILGENFTMTGLTVAVYYEGSITPEILEAPFGDAWVFSNTAIDTIGEKNVGLEYQADGGSIRTVIPITITNDLLGIELVDAEGSTLETVDYGGRDFPCLPTVVAGTDLKLDSAFLRLTLQDGVASSSDDFVHITQVMTDYVRSNKTEGYREIRISYSLRGKTQSVIAVVNVVPRSISAVQVMSLPDRLFYKAGATTVLELSGLELRLTFSNGSFINLTPEMRVAQSESQLTYVYVNEEGKSVTVYVAIDRISSELLGTGRADFQIFVTYNGLTSTRKELSLNDNIEGSTPISLSISSYVIEGKAPMVPASPISTSYDIVFTNEIVTGLSWIFAEDTYRIKTPTSLYSAASEDSAVVIDLNLGDVFTVLSASDPLWYNVSVGDESGFVLKDKTELVTAVPVQEYIEVREGYENFEYSEIADKYIMITIDEGESFLLMTANEVLDYLSVENYNPYKPGSQVVYFRYKGKRLDTTINVRAKSLKSISLAEDFAIPSTIQGLDLDLKKARLKVVYYDELSGAELPFTYIAVSKAMTNYDKTDLEVNDRVVRITYTYGSVSKELTYTVPVLKKSLISIGMGSIPKNKYIEGDSFTTEGGTIVLFYDNNTTKTLALDLRSEASSGITVDSENRFNTAEFTGFSKLQTMIVIYTEEGQEYQTSYDIIVKDRMYMSVSWQEDEYYDRTTATTTYWYGVVAVPEYTVYGYLEFSDIPKNPVPMNQGKNFYLSYIEVNPVSHERTGLVYTSWPKNTGTYLVSLSYNADSAENNDRIHNSFINEERYITISPKQITLQIQGYSRVYGKAMNATDITMKTLNTLTGSELDTYQYGDVYQSELGINGKFLFYNYLPASSNVIDIPLLWKYVYEDNVEGKTFLTDEEIRTMSDFSEITYLTNVGEYAIFATANGVVKNYALTFVYAIYSIEPRPIKVIPDAGQRKEYGQSDVLLTYTVSGIEGNPDSGMVDAQTLSGVLMRTVGENVDTYAINYGTLASSNPNYALGVNGVDGGTFVNNVTFEIYKRKLYLTVKNYSMIYGQNPPIFNNSSVTASSDYAGRDFITGDGFGSLSYSGGTNMSFTCYYDAVMGRAVDKTTGIGDYTINIVPTSVSSRNYDIGFFPGTLTINKRPVTVAVESKVKVFGEGDPILTYTKSGQVGNINSGMCNEDSLSILLVREAGEDVETKETLPSYIIGRPLSLQGIVKRYRITYQNNIVSANPNYDITFVENYLTIQKKRILISITNQGKAYDGLLPAVDGSGMALYRENGDLIAFYNEEGEIITNLYFSNGSVADLYDDGTNISTLYNTVGGSINGLYDASRNAVVSLFDKDGNAISEIEAQSIRKTVLSKQNIVVSFESPTKNIGRYNVIITHNDVNHIITYKDEFGYIYTITKKNVQPVFVDIPGTGSVGNVYKGSDYSFYAEVRPEDICSGDTLTVETDIRTAKLVKSDSYTVTMLGLSNPNYDFRPLNEGEDDYKTVSFALVPAIIDVRVKTLEKTYNGRTVTFDNNLVETTSGSGLYGTDDYEIQTVLPFRPTAVSVYPYYGEDLPPYQVAYEMDGNNNYIFRKDGQTLLCGSTATTFGAWTSANGWVLQNARTGEYYNPRYSFTINCIDPSVPFVGWAYDAGWEYTIVGYQIRVTSSDANYTARLVNAVGQVITNSEGLITEENSEYKFVIQPLEVPIMLNPNALSKQYDGMAPSIGTGFGVGSVLNKSMVFFGFDRITGPTSPYAYVLEGDSTITEEDYVVPEFMNNYITNADHGVFYVKPMTTNMNCIVKISDVSKKYFFIRTKNIESINISNASKPYDSKAPSFNPLTDIVFSNMTSSSKNYLKLKLVLDVSPDPLKGYEAGSYNFVLRGEFPYENPATHDDYKSYVDYNHKIDARLLDENGEYSNVYIIAQRSVKVELLEKEEEGYNWKYYDGSNAYPEFFETAYTAYDLASAGTDNLQYYLYGNGTGVEGVDYEYISTVLKQRNGKLSYTKFTTPDSNGATVNYSGVTGCDINNFYITYASKKVYIRKRPIKVYLQKVTEVYGTSPDKSKYLFTMDDEERNKLIGSYDSSNPSTTYNNLPDSDLFGSGTNRFGRYFLFQTTSLNYVCYDKEGNILNKNTPVDTDGSRGYYAYTEGGKLPTSTFFEISYDAEKVEGNFEIIRKELVVDYYDTTDKTVVRKYGDIIYNVQFSYTGFTEYDVGLENSEMFIKPSFVLKGRGKNSFENIGVLDNAIELAYDEGTNENYYFSYRIVAQDLRLKIITKELGITVVSDSAYNSFGNSYIWDETTELERVTSYVYIYNSKGMVKAVPQSTYTQTVAETADFTAAQAYTAVRNDANVWSQPFLPDDYVFISNAAGETKAVLSTVYNSVISALPYSLDTDSAYALFTEYEYLYNDAGTLKLVPVAVYNSGTSSAGNYYKVVEDVYGSFSEDTVTYTFDGINAETGGQYVMITNGTGYKLIPSEDFIAGVTNQTFTPNALYNLFEDYEEWNYALIINERTNEARRVNADEYSTLEREDYLYTAEEVFASFPENDWSGISRLTYPSYYVVISDEIDGLLRFKAMMGEVFYPVAANGYVGGMDAYNIFGSQYLWDYKLVYSMQGELKVVPTSVYNTISKPEINSTVVYSSFGAETVIADLANVNYAQPSSVVIGGIDGFKLLSGQSFYATAGSAAGFSAVDFYNEFKANELPVSNNISGYDLGFVYINNAANTRYRRIRVAEFYENLSTYLFYNRFSEDYVVTGKIWDAGNVVLGDGKGNFKVVPEDVYYSLLAKETYFRAFETAVSWTANYVFVTDGGGNFRAVPSTEFYDLLYAEIEYNLFSDEYIMTGNKDFIFIYDATGVEKPIKKSIFYNTIKESVWNNILLSAGDVGFSQSNRDAVIEEFTPDIEDYFYDMFIIPEYSVDVWEREVKTNDYVLLYSRDGLFVKAVPVDVFYTNVINEIVYLSIKNDYSWDYIFILNDAGEVTAKDRDVLYSELFEEIAKHITANDSYNLTGFGANPDFLYESFDESYLWKYVSVYYNGNVVNVPLSVYNNEINSVAANGTQAIYEHFAATDYTSPAFLKQFVFLFGENGEMKAVPTSVFYARLTEELIYWLFPASAVYAEDLTESYFSAFSTFDASGEYVYLFRNRGNETEIKKIPKALFYDALCLFGDTSLITEEFVLGNIAALGNSGGEVLVNPRAIDLTFTSNEYHFLLPVVGGMKLISGEIMLNNGLDRLVPMISTIFVGFDNALNRNYYYISDDGVGEEYVFIYSHDGNIVLQTKAVPEKEYKAIIAGESYSTKLEAEYGFPPSLFAYVYEGMRNPSLTNNPKSMEITNEITSNMNLDVTEEGEHHDLSANKINSTTPPHNYTYKFLTTQYVVNKKTIDVYLRLVDTGAQKEALNFKLFYNEPPYTVIPAEDAGKPENYNRKLFEYVIGIDSEGNSQLAYFDEIGEGSTFGVNTEKLDVIYDRAGCYENGIIQATGLSGDNYSFNYIPSVINVYRRAVAIGTETTPTLGEYSLAETDFISVLTANEIQTTSAVYNAITDSPEISFLGTDVSGFSCSPPKVYLFNADHTKYKLVTMENLLMKLQQMINKKNAITAGQKNLALPTDITASTEITSPYSVINISDSNEYTLGTGSEFYSAIFGSDLSASEGYALLNVAETEYNNSIGILQSGYMYFFDAMDAGTGEKNHYKRLSPTDAYAILQAKINAMHAITPDNQAAAFAVTDNPLANPTNVNLVGYDIVLAIAKDGEEGLYLPYVITKSENSAKPDMMIKVYYNNGETDYYNLKDVNVTKTGTDITYLNLGSGKYAMNFEVLDPIPNRELYDENQQMRISFTESFFGTHTYTFTSEPFWVRYYPSEDSLVFGTDTAADDFGTVDYNEETGLNATYYAKKPDGTNFDGNFDKLDATFSLIAGKGANHAFNLIIDKVGSSYKRMVLSIEKSSGGSYNTVYIELYDMLNNLLSNMPLTIDGQLDFFDGKKHNIVVYKDRLGSNLVYDTSGYNLVVIIDSQYYYSLDVGYSTNRGVLEYSPANTSEAGFETVNVCACMNKFELTRLGLDSSVAMKVYPKAGATFYYQVPNESAKASVTWRSLLKSSTSARSSYKECAEASSTSYEIIVNGIVETSLESKLSIGKYDVAAIVYYKMPNGTNIPMDTLNFTIIVSLPFNKASINSSAYATFNRGIEITDGNNSTNKMSTAYDYYRLVFDMTFRENSTSLIYIKTNMPDENIITTENVSYFGIALSVKRVDGVFYTKLHFRNGAEYFELDFESTISVFDTPIYGLSPVNWATDGINSTVLEAIFDDRNMRITISVSRGNTILYYNRFGNGNSSEQKGELEILSLAPYINRTGDFYSPIVLDGADMTVYQLQRGFELTAQPDFIDQNNNYVASNGNLLVESNTRLIAATRNHGYYLQDYSSLTVKLKGETTGITDAASIGEKKVMFRIWLTSNLPDFRLVKDQDELFNTRGSYLEYVRLCTGIQESGGVSTYEYEFYLRLGMYKNERQYVEQILYTTDEITNQYGESPDGYVNLLDNVGHTVTISIDPNVVQDTRRVIVKIDDTEYTQGLYISEILPLHIPEFDFYSMSYYVGNSIISGNDIEYNQSGYDPFNLSEYTYFGFETVDTPVRVLSFDVQ